MKINRNPQINAFHAPVPLRRARRIKALPKARPVAAPKPALHCCWQEAGDGSGLLMAWTSDPGQGAPPAWLRYLPYSLPRLRAR